MQINKKIIQSESPDPVGLFANLYTVCCQLTTLHVISHVNTCLVYSKKNCCLLTALFCRQMELHPVNHLIKIDRMKKVNNMVAFLLGSEIQVLGGIHVTVPDDVLLNSK